MGKRKRSKVANPPPATMPQRRGRRAYEGAMVSRLTSDWVTSNTSADAEIDGSLVRLRNRSRQLVRDNPYARQAIRAIGANVVGRGIRLQGRVPMQRGGGRLDENLNRGCRSLRSCGWRSAALPNQARCSCGSCRSPWAVAVCRCRWR